MINNNCGLVNVNNSCYINTAIQCLRFCPSIYRIFEKEKDTTLYKYLTSNVNNIAKERILSANIYFNFKLLVETLNEKKNINIRPNEYLNANIELAKIRNMGYLFGDQNDIGEYLLFLLEAFHSAKCYSPHIEIKPNDNKVLYDAYYKFKEIYASKYSCIVREFNYMTINNIKCVKCGYNTYTYESNQILNVSINKFNSITDCIDEYFNNIINMWKCDKCSEVNNADMEIKMLNGPNTLIIMINRFAQNLRKNSKKIHIDHNINLNKYVVDGSKNNNYKLVAIANHYGTESCGHYTAICYCEGIWQEYDDQNVRAVNCNNIESGNVYLLFYNKE